MTSTPIVFLHGATSDPDVWSGQTSYFDSRRQVIAPDLTQLDSVESMAAHILESVKGRFILCGTSMGGYACFEIMRRAAERVERLILCNTSARADTEQRKKERQKEIDAGEESFLQARRDPAYFNVFLGQPARKSQHILKLMKETSERVGFKPFKRHMRACLNRPDSRETLSHIRIPTLIIGGNEDTVTPLECQHEIYAAIAGAVLVTLPDTGHIAHIESPSAFNDAISAFLSETER